MKGIPIKRDWKTVIFSRSRGVWSSPYMSLFLPFTWPPLSPPTIPPTPSLLVCCVKCGSCGSVFNVFDALPGLRFDQWEKSSQPPLFTFTAVGCCVLSFHLSAPLFLHFSNVDLLFSSGLLDAVSFQLCLCYHNIQVPWDRAVYGKHITTGTVPG